MTRKTRRELEREIADLRADAVDDLDEFEVAPPVVTVYGSDDPPEATVPDDGTIIPTESPVVTWWVESTE